MTVISYMLSYNPQANVGSIRIQLQNGTQQNFTNLSQTEFLSMVAVLNEAPVFWNGAWLYTGPEMV